MTNLLLHELFRNPDAFRMVEIDEDTRARLPGVNVLPQEIPAVA